MGLIFASLLLLGLLFFILNTRLFLTKRNLSTDWIQAILLGTVIWGTWLTLITELLSLFGALQFYALTGSWGLTIVILSLWWWIHKNPNFLINKLQLQSPSLLFGLSALGIALIVGGTGLIAIISAPNNWDSMTYHLSRVMNWSQNQSVAHYATHELRQLYQPPWAEFLIIHFQILGGADRFANLAQWLGMVGCILGVSLIAHQLQANIEGQYLAALIAATIPMGILQAVTTQNDYVLSFWLVCFVSFGLAAKQELNGIWLAGLAGSLGLAVLTKGTAYIFAAPFIIWFGVRLLKTYRWRAWQPALVIGIIVIVINNGHFYRNFQLFGSPLQPAALGDYNYANQKFTPAIFVSNLTRNMALHISVPLPFLVNSVEQGVERFHHILNLDPNDPATTWAGFGFSLAPFRVDENTSGNFIHFILILFMLGLIGVRWEEVSKNQSVLIYGGLLTLGFFLFVSYLKWQPWHSRLHLPLFVLWAPVMGLSLAQFLQRWLLNVVALLLIIQTLPFLLMNPFHPVFNERNIFNLDRNDQYFLSRPVLQAPYQAATQMISEENCRSVGLNLPGDAWEYPFWVLLDAQNGPVQIKSLDVENESRIFQEETVTSCAIICMSCQETQITHYTGKFGTPRLSYETNFLFIQQ